MSTRKITLPIFPSIVSAPNTEVILNTNNLSIKDNIIVINRDNNNNISGIQIERGLLNPVKIIWNESTQSVEAGIDGSLLKVARISENTTNGLVRWNGNTLESYTDGLGSSSSIGNGIGSNVNVNSNNEIIFNTNNEIVKFDQYKSQIHNKLFINGGLNLKTITITENYTITENESMIVFNGTQSINIYLPSAFSNPGRIIIIENVTLFIISILLFGVDTFEGQTESIILDSKFSSIMLISNGISNWLLI